MNRKTKNIAYPSKKGKIYELRVANLNIEMNYSTDNKKINECMLNILKQKIGK